MFQVFVNVLEYNLFLPALDLISLNNINSILEKRRLTFQICVLFYRFDLICTFDINLNMFSIIEC